MSCLDRARPDRQKANARSREREPFQRHDAHPDHRVVLGRFAERAQEIRERGCVVADGSSLCSVRDAANSSLNLPQRRSISRSRAGPRRRVTARKPLWNSMKPCYPDPMRFYRADGLTIGGAIVATASASYFLALVVGWIGVGVLG